MGKHLVIVESPAKAKTIGKYLGKDFKVEASIGHIRDLPSNAQDVPEKYKKEKWARLGVDIENDFKPFYVVSDTKKKQVEKLKQALKGVDELYLATDEDREGESISWHLLEVLKPKVKIKRLVFHEITKEAIEKALEKPREVDMNLVHAQETRRILDRLYGYEVSPVLWRKIAPKLSAGRVQSVAIRLVVEREKQRMKFVPATYFDLAAKFSKKSGESFLADLKAIGDKKLVTGKDFDPETGKLKGNKKVMLGEAEAKELAEAVLKNTFAVSNLETKPYKRTPEAPFTTSTLQQEAARKLRFSAKKTMQVAQKLYENGFITYMRTDSTNLAESAVKEARNLAEKLYGAEYLSPAVKVYASKVKNAQEAHEAIRPSGNKFRLPENLKSELDEDQLALYDLIWKRTIASQMKDAQMETTSVEISDGKHIFGATGKRIVFAGFLKAYVQGSDDPEEELEDQEKLLPELALQEALKIEKVDPKLHQTKPIGRYTEAALIKELESRGIGRPSTYAAIMDTIVRREYVFKQSNTLIPTFVAFAVVGLMEKFFKHLVDYEFTAEMEQDLDEIASGNKSPTPYLKAFYYGGAEHAGLQSLINQEIDAREVCTFELGKLQDGKIATVRIGKFGPFLEVDGKRASLADETIPADLNGEKIEELLKNAESSGAAGAGEKIGEDSISGLPIFKKVGRFGPYLQLGEKGEKNFKMKSIPKFVNAENLDLATAQKIIELPKSLGKTKDGSEVILDIGPYGPYLKHGGKNKAIPNGFDVLNLTLEDAEKVLSAAATGGARGKAGAAPGANILKDFGEGMVLKIGRYGPYITDGKKNAALPKGVNQHDLTAEKAKEILANK